MTSSNLLATTTAMNTTVDDDQKFTPIEGMMIDKLFGIFFVILNDEFFF